MSETFDRAIRKLELAIDREEEKLSRARKMRVRAEDNLRVGREAVSLAENRINSFQIRRIDIEQSAKAVKDLP